MKQKAKFVEAGPATISLIYPSAFKELCKELNIEPETAINCLIKELTFYSVIFPEKTKAQAYASLLFNQIPGIISGLPGEPSRKKKKIGSDLILSLMKANSKISDPVMLVTKRMQLIKNAYLQYKKSCVCFGRSK